MKAVTTVKITVIALAVLFSSSICQTQTVNPTVPSNGKIYSVLQESIHKMMTDGIGAVHLKDPSLRRRYASPFVHIDDEGRIGVILTVRAITPDILRTIAMVGGVTVREYQSSRLITAYLPIGSLDTIAELEDVYIMKPMISGITNSGTVTSEGDSLHHAKNVRLDLDAQGDSIRVGVISDGCEHWNTVKGWGDLPSNFNATHFSFASGNHIGQGDEGTEMMEIIHDLAPTADLYFAGVFGTGGGSFSMVNAIDSLWIDKRCRVIVDDITFFDQPMFEDSTPNTAWTIASAARRALDSGVVYVSSAGNYARGGSTDRSHYQATWSDINPGTIPPPLPVPPKVALPNGPIVAPFNPPFSDLHAFNVADAGLRIIVPPISAQSLYLVVILQWNDPWSASNDDYDLYLYDKNLQVKRAQSISLQNGLWPQDPYEAIILTHEPYPETLNVVINHFSQPIPGTPPKLLGMYISGCSWVEYNTPANSIWGQPGVPGVLAVGAVPYSNISTIEPFSSRGTYNVYFPVFESRFKPDLVATDGVKITGAGIGWGSWDGSNYRFYGTSASAPHVAAMSAQILSQSPFMTPAQIQSKFHRTAVDLDGVGFDATYGFGRADVELAMMELDTAAGTHGPYADIITLDTPAHSTTSDGYAVSTMTVTGGADPPDSIHVSVAKTTGNPYAGAGIVDLGCPTLKRWYGVTQSGGTNGNYDAEMTLYADQTEMSAAGVTPEDVRIIHWNGSYFHVLPKIGTNSTIGNTWRIRGTFVDASFSPFFLGVLTRGLAVQRTANDHGSGDTTLYARFDVRNDGNGWDTLSIHVRDTKGWTLSPVDSGFAIDGNDTAPIAIGVTLLSSYPAGTVDTVWFIARSISDPSYIDSTFATITVTSTSTTVTIFRTLPDGWSLVSVPVTVQVCHRDSLYPTAISTMFGYQSGYVEAESLTYGTGYWLKFSGEQVAEITGDPREEDTLDLVQRWNIIGSISEPVPVDSILELSDGLIVSSYWEFDGSYDAADTIKPGEGYWVKAASAGQIVLRASSPSATPVTHPRFEDLRENLSTMTFHDQRGRIQTLYIGSRDQVGEWYDRFELPPPPPAGAFDVRFSSNRLLEAYTDGNPVCFMTIDILPTGHPLELTWAIRESGASYFLNIGTTTLPLDLAGNQRILIPSSINRLTVERRIDGAPLDFSLEQNYPNPFNPETQIRYVIPERSFVTLAVYNTLGQKIKTLIAAEQEPGRKVVRFAAEDLADGMYFYRLTAGMHSTVRKMVLMK